MPLYVFPKISSHTLRLSGSAESCACNADFTSCLQPIGHHGKQQMARQMQRWLASEHTLPARPQSFEIEIAQMRDLVLQRPFGCRMGNRSCSPHDITPHPRPGHRRSDRGVRFQLSPRLDGGGVSCARRLRENRAPSAAATLLHARWHRWSRRSALVASPGYGPACFPRVRSASLKIGAADRPRAVCRA